MIRWALAMLLLAGCAGLPDGHDVQGDIADYAYGNQPVHQNDIGLRSGMAGAAIASSDIPWRIPAECRRDFRAWLSAQASPRPQDAFLQQRRCPGPPKDIFTGVAITGGGNKSAVFAAEVLFELERYGIAQQIDVLSSVSGGSFTAALYALSCDPLDKPCPRTEPGWTRPAWTYAEISKRLEENYLMPFLARRVAPTNYVRNLVTHHNAADDMAAIVGNHLLQEPAGRLHFTDLNPARPNLILNATNVTRGRAAFDQDSGVPYEDRRPLSDDEALHFAFTQQYFWRLLSRLDDYPLGDAVVASAAFPLLIDRPTLRVFRRDEVDALDAKQPPPHPPLYVSLYDGGVHDNFGLTELRWFVECQFGRNARRAVWTPAIRRRICGQEKPPAVRPGATLILGINSSLLRSTGVTADRPKPRTWDSYLGPLRIAGTADSVDLIMAASGELRKMELRSLIEEVSRATAGPRAAPADNPFLAPGRHQYVDIDIEAAHYLSCLDPIPLDWSYKGDLGDPRVLNTANGGSEARRCEALVGILDWQKRRGLALLETPPGFCSRADCPELDRIVGDRTLGKGAPKPDDLFIAPDGLDRRRLVSNQLLFEAVRDVPTSFELSQTYVRLLRQVARWAVARRMWELCADHRDLLERMPRGAGPVCDAPLPPRAT